MHRATDTDLVTRRVAGTGGREHKSGGGIRPTAIAGGGGGGGGSVTVTSITPSNGIPTDTVVIAGTNFQSGQSVLINGISFDSIVYTSSTQINATVPSGVGGSGATYDISVAGVTLASAFTWYASASLFVSDFSNTTGTGDPAVRDGTKWHADVYNPDGYLEVVTAASAGIDDDWPTTNALRVTRSSTKTARAWTSLDAAWAAPALGETLYFRMFLRFDAPTATATENSNHPVEAVYVVSGGSDSSNKYTWKFAPISGNRFDLAFWVNNVPNPSHYAFRLLTSGGARTHFNQDETYRLEWSLKNEGTNSYTVNLRVYDNTNTLMGVSDSASWRSAFSPYPLIEATPYTIADAQVRDLRVGNNGATWTNTTDEYYYMGGFMVRSDTWCGPY